MHLYHFTDTCRLPWILQADELRPGANKAGGFPEPEFVWTTTDARGDGTASIARGAPYQSGKVRHVRFTLDSEGFMPWSEVPRAFPTWAPAQVARLETWAGTNGDPRAWWCCPKPVKAKRWLAIDSRSWTDNRWRALDLGTKATPAGNADGLAWLGVEVVGLPFVSAKVTAADGRTGYALR